MPKPSTGRKIAAGLAVLFGLLFSGNLIYHAGFKPATMAFDNEVGRIGRALLYTGDGGFVLPFELVSILLLAAMIGCIVIAMKPEKENSPKVRNEFKTLETPEEIAN
jgi:NADH-quinone oxidoreductase subunit J